MCSACGCFILFVSKLQALTVFWCLASMFRSRRSHNRVSNTPTPHIQRSPFKIKFHVRLILNTLFLLLMTDIVMRIKLHDSNLASKKVVLYKA